MADKVINKSNIVSLGGTSWYHSFAPSVTTEDSGTIYIYGPVARVYSYAKKGLLLAVAYTYVSIYAYRGGDWVPLGSCNSIRESGDSGSTSNNWYYNYTGYNGQDSLFKVTYSIHCNGAGDRGGQVAVYAGGLSMAHADVYGHFYHEPIKGTRCVCSGTFDIGQTSMGNYKQGTKILSTNVQNLHAL